MNDTFSLKRFGWLFKKTLLERPAQLFGLIALILLLDLLLYFIGINIRMAWGAVQELTFILGLVGGGSFLGAVVFNYFSSSSNGISYLTLPASPVEKWLTGVIISGILFPFVFLIFYHYMDLGFVASYHKGLDPKSPFYREAYNRVFPFALNGFVARTAYIMFLNFTGAMLIGSLYFNKATFIKVALLICLLFIGAAFLNTVIANAVFNNINVDRAVPYYCVFIGVDKEFGKLLLPDLPSSVVDACMIFIVPAILWLTTLVRLHEKEF